MKRNMNQKYCGAAGLIPCLQRLVEGRERRQERNKTPGEEVCQKEHKTKLRCESKRNKLSYQFL